MEKLKDNKAYYKVSFADWLAKHYPDFRLLDWQIKVANILLNQPVMAGKTRLIKIFAEYDQSAS